MARPDLPSFDLVVATIGRTEELDALLASLERQTYRAFRVVLVDQNEDDRLAPLVAAHEAVEVLHLRSAPGLSRGRNRALRELRANVVAFPDDDCAYPSALLESVAARLAAHPELDGIAGRTVSRDGVSSASWKRDTSIITDENLWNRAASGTTFLRTQVVREVGEFDVALGRGAGTPSSAGEETEYLVRTVRAGFRIQYDPELIVTHDDPSLSEAGAGATGYREGASLGYILRKHRYPARVLARMLVRPVGGVALALLRRDRVGARFHAATLRGRVAGYRTGARPARANASARPER